MTDDPLAAVEEELLGGPRRHTRAEVAELANVDPERTRRLWLAMGFAEADDDERLFTDGDVEALATLKALIDTGAISEDMEVAIARAFGQSLSRLAQWETNEIRNRIGTLTDDQDEASQIVLALIPIIEKLQSYVWRRHVVASGGRLLNTRPGEDERELKTVGFADIVGYTATTRHMDAEALAVLLDAFEQDAAEVIAHHHGQVVKTVGDEVFFTVDEPVDAARIALRLTSPDREEAGLPLLRVGMALGPVLSRFGDVYGSVVNIAARLTSLARPGTALVDSDLARTLGETNHFKLRSLRPVSVRGFQHLRPSVLREATTDGVR